MRIEDQDGSTPARTPRRSIEAILQRRRRRQRQRCHTHPPDFWHGNCQLGAIYATYGRRWVEGTVFAEVLRDGEGGAVGWTIATFEERFLTLRHAVASEVEDPAGWLGEQTAGRSRVLLLDIDADARSEARTGWTLPDELDVLSIAASAAGIRRLEQRHLNVTRDRRFPPRSRFEDATDALLLESRLNVSSLVCLAATDSLIQPDR